MRRLGTFKPRLFFHIGVHRTGTTTLQIFLHANRRLLARQGVRYALASDERDHLGGGLFREQGAEAFVQALVDDHVASGCERLIVSDEAFSTLVAVEELAALREYFDVRVICYLRRQDRWLESWYNQHVRWPWHPQLSRLSPNEFFARRAEFYWLDYGQTIDRWSAVFGNEHVIVRVFEVGQILSSLQEDFCQSCGIDSAQLTCGDRVDNASTPASALALLRRLALFDKDSDRRWVITQTVADVYAGRAQGTPSDAFTGEQHCQILAELGASNAKVAREYLGRPDGVLFRAPGPEPSSFPVASDLPEVPALCRDILAPVLHKLAVRLTGNEELVSQAAALEVAQIASRALRDGLRSSNAELAREGLVVPASLRPIGNTRNSGF